MINYNSHTTYCRLQYCIAYHFRVYFIHHDAKALSSGSTIFSYFKVSLYCVKLRKGGSKRSTREINIYIMCCNYFSRVSQYTNIYRSSLFIDDSRQQLCDTLFWTTVMFYMHIIIIYPSTRQSTVGRRQYTVTSRTVMGTNA